MPQPLMKTYALLLRPNEFTKAPISLTNIFSSFEELSKEKHCPLSIYQHDNMFLIEAYLAGAALELYIWQIIRA